MKKNQSPRRPRVFTIDDDQKEHVGETVEKSGNSQGVASKLESILTDNSEAPQSKSANGPEKADDGIRVTSPHVIDLSNTQNDTLRETPFPGQEAFPPSPEEQRMDPVSNHKEDEVKIPAIPTFEEIRKGLTWYGVLWAAISGILILTVTAWATTYVKQLMARNDWIGWSLVGLLVAATLAVVMIALREYLALRKLKSMSVLRTKADIAYENNQSEQAKEVVDDLMQTFASKKELIWKQKRMKEHMADVRDAQEILTLAERELVMPLDPKAHEIISDAARRVSVVTALSPFAILDIGFVLYENMKMLRRMSLLYGGKPGVLSLFKMIKMVLGHLAITGGVALADDVLRQILSHSVAAKLSAKLGQGLLNGALTARIGIAAMGAVRPLPHLESQPPSFRAIAVEALDIRKL